MQGPAIPDPSPAPVPPPSPSPTPSSIPSTTSQAGSGPRFRPLTNPDYEAAVWDPMDGKITTQRVNWDMFCKGMSLMQDGRVLINGGAASYGSLAPLRHESPPFSRRSTWKM